MSRNSFFYFLTIILFGSLMGCKLDDESPVRNIPPTISNVTLNGSVPGEEILVIPGNEMLFEATFSDDDELGQYRIEIHDDFDDHNHGKLKSEVFEFDQIYDLTGTSQTVQENIDIPANATPGQYHFTLSYFDAAGNEGEPVIIEFVIADVSGYPVINIVSPVFDEEIETAPGENIVFEGTVTDSDGLEKVIIQLLIHNEGDGNPGNDEILHEVAYELNADATFNFDTADPFEVPEGTTPGHYELKIIAVDVLGNSSSKTAEIHVQ